MKSILIASLITCCMISCSKQAIVELRKEKFTRVTSISDTLKPEANGSVIENFPNWGGAGMNYWCAADTGNYGLNNLYLYQTGGNSTCLDLYTSTNTVSSGSTINSVTICVYATTNNNKGVVGTGSIRLAVKENGITTYGLSHSLPVSATYTFVTETFSVRPSDGNSWTPTDINGMEYGFSQTRPGGAGFTKTGHVFCIVNYN